MGCRQEIKGDRGRSGGWTVRRGGEILPPLSFSKIGACFTVAIVPRPLQMQCSV